MRIILKTLLFSLTKRDFDVQSFRSGGPGGQNQNKVSSGCRIIHRASGAVGEARDSRSFHQNKKTAFERLTNSPIFKGWLRIETAKRLGLFKNLEARVEKMMALENLKIEGIDSNLPEDYNKG